MQSPDLLIPPRFCVPVSRRFEGIVLPADWNPTVFEELVQEILVWESEVFHARVCGAEVLDAGPKLVGGCADEDPRIQELIRWFGTFGRFRGDNGRGQGRGMFESCIRTGISVPFGRCPGVVVYVADARVMRENPVWSRPRDGKDVIHIPEDHNIAVEET